MHIYSATVYTMLLCKCSISHLYYDHAKKDFVVNDICVLRIPLPSKLWGQRLITLVNLYKHICLSQKGQLSLQVNPLSTDVGTTELGLTKEYRQTDRHRQLFLLYIVDE